YPCAMTPLEIREGHTLLGSARLALGWESLARDCFRHDPPSPLDMENAIAAIEDEIARAGKPAEGGTTLFSRDAALRDIAVAAGLPREGDANLSIEAVERTFQRLVERDPRLPANARFAATLLIL